MRRSEENAMRMVITALLLALTLTGCTTASIYSADDDDDAMPPTGRVTPLRTLIPQGSSLRLILVHGVGDHCAGYALDPDTGWFDRKARDTIGLSAPVVDRDEQRIPAATFLDTAADPKAFVSYARSRYSLHLDDGRDIDVMAIEITWSGLTRWLKSNQLGYDARSTTPLPGAKVDGCVTAPDASVLAMKAAPSRLRLDRALKENLFDRSLADAILYSGTYGGAMEKGMAEALCHALTDQPNDSPCVWPEPPGDDHVVNLFVTHSLGSRLVYDTLLHLQGVATPGRGNPFGSAQAAPYASHLLAVTPAFYLMANQLALLGLANVPETASPLEGGVPDRIIVHRPLALDARADAGARSGAGAVPDAAPTTRSDVLAAPPGSAAPGNTPTRSQPVYGSDILSQLVLARGASLHGLVALPRLQLIAFNDTNDLLTWHIPRWYARTVDGADSKPLPIDMANVFVTNAPKLVVAENPLAAHDDYFFNPIVWQTIRCGGHDGRVDDCPQGH